MVDVLFWFIVQPTEDNDSIKTTVTSMTTVLTTTMTLRSILSVRGSLAQGGSYAGSTVASSTARGTSTHVISTNTGRPQQAHPASFGPTGSTFGVQSTGGNVVLNIGGYSAERKGSLSSGLGARGVVGGMGKELGDKAREGWNEGASDARSSVLEGKEGEAFGVHLLHLRFLLLLLLLLVDVGMKASRLRLIVRSIILDDSRRWSAERLACAYGSR